MAGLACQMYSFPLYWMLLNSAPNRLKEALTRSLLIEIFSMLVIPQGEVFFIDHKGIVELVFVIFGMLLFRDFLPSGIIQGREKGIPFRSGIHFGDDQFICDRQCHFKNLSTSEDKDLLQAL